MIIVGALLSGLWLDNLLDTRPILTIVCILASIPVSLFSVVRIALSAAEHGSNPHADEETSEEKEKQPSVRKRLSSLHRLSLVVVGAALWLSSGFLGSLGIEL